jgi:AraC-like DNA-binding protein
MKEVHEIMIQFPANLFSNSLLQKNQMTSLRKLLENAKRGVSFGQKGCKNMKEKILEIMTTQAGFYRVLKLYEILYELSLQTDQHVLASDSFAHTRIDDSDSRRVRKVKEYIEREYKNDVSLPTLASLAGMTPTSFSRFFKVRTGKSLSDYIIDIRLGHASRHLADSKMSIVEICYDSGFNNVSNFNRISKKKKVCTPSTFRENYHNILKQHVLNESSIAKKDKFHKKKEII